jgi:hypothetical protein
MDVLAKLVKKRPSPRGTCVLLHKRVVSKLAARRRPRRVLWHSRACLQLGFLAQVKIQLISQFGFLLASLRQPEKFSEKCHHCASSSAGDKISPTAREKARHLDCSALSCFRPRAVRR